MFLLCRFIQTTMAQNQDSTCTYLARIHLILDAASSFDARPFYPGLPRLRMPDPVIVLILSPIGKSTSVFVSQEISSIVASGSRFPCRVVESHLLPQRPSFRIVLWKRNASLFKAGQPGDNYPTVIPDGGGRDPEAFQHGGWHSSSHFRTFQPTRPQYSYALKSSLFWFF